jgi:hypothetical protein
VSGVEYAYQFVSGVRGGGGVAKASGEEGRIGDDSRGEGVGVRGRSLRYF